MSTCTIMEGPPAAWLGPSLKKFLENIPPYYDFTTYSNRRSRSPEYRSRRRNHRSRSPEYAGEVNEWHFGHLAMQERPECAVGAHNLLRRLGVQYLHDLPLLHLPPYRQVLTRQGRFGQIREVVEWQSEVVKVTDWNLTAARGQRIGVLTLLDGANIDMFIDIGSQRPSHQSHLSHGKIVFYCPLPDPESLRTQDKASPVWTA